MTLQSEAVDRDEALRLFCDTLALAAVAQGTTSIVRLIAWLEARGENEGGFLWLAGVLGYPPNRMQQMICETMESTTRHRRSITKRLQRVIGA